jgi:hypothetical protein
MKTTEMNAQSHLFFGSLVAFTAFALRRRSASRDQVQSERTADQTKGTDSTLVDANASSMAKPRSWLDRIDAFFWRQEMRAHDAYLSKASNVYELEARMRDISRGVGSRYF